MSLERNNHQRMKRKATQLYLGGGGFMLLETLISIVIFAIFAMFFVASFNNIFASQQTSWSRAEASLYAQEGLEVSYNIFVNTENWEALTSALSELESYRVRRESPPSFFQGRELLDGGYTREIKFERVYRNPTTHVIADKDLDLSAQLDPDTIMVKSIVSWDSKGNQESTEFVTYLIKPLHSE